MRPHKLTMKAFGPFAKTTVVDFDAMGNNIYLISGNTGAGKTTIFDGIIYALYGTASGGARSELGSEAYHSDYAKESGRREEMLVELIFSNAGRTFTVSRRMYWGKKGDSKTVSKESTLSENGNTIVFAKGSEKKDDVTLKVTEILGLDVGQFKRIIMLAQGEFQKFLTDKSDKRGDILGKLYDNRKHQDFQFRLKAAYSLLNELKVSADKDADALLNMLIIPDYIRDEDRAEIKLDHFNLLPAIYRICEQMDAELSTLQNAVSEKEKDKRVLEEQKSKGEISNGLLDDLNRNIDKLKDSDEKENEINDKRNLVRLAEAAEKVLPYENAKKQADDKWKDALDNIQKLEAEKERLKVQAAELDQKSKTVNTQNTPLINKLKQEANSIQNILHFYDDLSASIEEQTAKEEARKKALKNFKIAEESLKQKTDRKKELEIELQSFETAGEMAVSIAKKAKDDLTQRRKSLEDIKTSVATVKEHDQELTALNSKRMTAQNKEVTAETNHLSLNKMFIQGQAGILANDLREKLKTEEAVVCPVCGSIHTEADLQSFAVLHDDIPTREEVDNAYKLWQDAREAANGAVKEYNEKEKNISVKKQSILTKTKELINISDWDTLTEGTALLNAIEECERLLPDAEEKLKQAKIDKEKKDQALSEKEQIDGLIEKAERERSEAESKKNTAINEAESANTSVNNWKQQLEGYPENKSAAIELMDSLNTKAGLYQQQIDDAKKEYSDCQKNQAENTGNLNSAVSEKIDREKEKNKATEEFDHQLKKWLFKDTDEYHKALCPEGSLLGQDILAEWIKKENEEISDYDQKRSDLKAAIKQLGVSTKDMQWVDIKAIQAQINDVFEQIRIMGSQKTNLEAKINQDKIIYDKLVLVQKRRNNYKKMDDKLEPLAKTADGRYPFSRYVLYDFFQRIVEQANIHLETMTDGEYCLVPKESSFDGRKLIGLDLKVLNTITGLERETATLSGGQLFEASLALALGLSDIVQMDSTSSIQIESMFIDEGFGSLDSGRLDKSIQVLEHLSAGKRQIGIISHVSRLDECLPKKIHVIAGERGSTIRIETDA